MQRPVIIVLLLASLVAACAWIFWPRGSPVQARQETEASLRAWLQGHPADTAATERLAALLVSQGRSREAIPLYETVVTNAPDNASAPCALARLLAGEGRTLEAQRLLEKNLKAHPTDAASNEMLADMLVKSLGQAAYAGAQPMYEVSLKSEPQRASAAISLAKIYLSQHRLDAARGVLERAQKAAPRNSALELQLAGVLAKQGQYDAAVLHFDAATVLEPHNADAFAAWGAMLVEAGRTRAAEIVLRKAIELNGEQPDYHLQLGRALRDQGQYSAAMKEFELALDKGKSAPVYLEMARTLLSDHQERSAERFLRDAIGIDRRYTEAKIALAQLLTNAGDPAQRNLWEAADLLRQTVEETQGQDISLLAAHAAALARVEMYDLAIEEIDKAMAVGRVHGLGPVPCERLLELRQSYFVSSQPATPGAPSVLTVQGMVIHDPVDDPFPPPRQPPMEALVDKPLDVTKPSGPGTALDPEIFAAAAQAPDTHGAILIPGNPR